MIGAFGDLHGRLARWKRVHELAAESHVNLLICTGDVTPIVNSTSIPLLIIYGNHDTLDEIRNRSLWLRDGVNRQYGYTIYAINGNYAKTAKRPHHKDSHILNALFKTCSEATVDIAVTHEPPEGVLWRGRKKFRSICSEVVTDFITQLKPKVWIYGHCYMEEPAQKLGDIMTVNVDCRFVTIDQKTWTIERAVRL
jgi:Icc-related predicted phosphoesterase